MLENSNTEILQSLGVPILFLMKNVSNNCLILSVTWISSSEGVPFVSGITHYRITALKNGFSSKSRSVSNT